MNRYRILCLMFGCCFPPHLPQLQAASPLASLFPFKRVEADPQKSYQLQEQHGPWLIVAATFAGRSGKSQARQLVLELRKKYKLLAYTYDREFDFGKRVTGLGVDKYGKPKKMRYVSAPQFVETAVLVGNFPDVTDPEAQAVLEKLKYAKPETLSGVTKKPTSQRMAVLREIQRRITPNPEKKKRGPMRAAFLTRNPLLPEEYFTSKGPDKLILQLNEGLEYSLLDCPGKISVQVATFRGDYTWNLKEIDELENERTLPFLKDAHQSKLAQAAAQAAKLTFALREQGVEAYQFHDRRASIVTVGSFESEGRRRPDGKIEIDPAVYRIMQQYKADVENLPGLPGAVKPRRLAGISFDAQPIPVRVPKASVVERIVRGRR